MKLIEYFTVLVSINCFQFPILLYIFRVWTTAVCLDGTNYLHWPEVIMRGRTQVMHQYLVPLTWTRNHQTVTSDGRLLLHLSMCSILPLSTSNISSFCSPSFCLKYLFFLFSFILPQISLLSVLLHSASNISSWLSYLSFCLRQRKLFDVI